MPSGGETDNTLFLASLGATSVAQPQGAAEAAVSSDAASRKATAHRVVNGGGHWGCMSSMPRSLVTLFAACQAETVAMYQAGGDLGAIVPAEFVELLEGCMTGGATYRKCSAVRVRCCLYSLLALPTRAVRRVEPCMSDGRGHSGGGGGGGAGVCGGHVAGLKDGVQAAGQGQGDSTPRARDGELVGAYGCLPYVQHVWA